MPDTALLDRLQRDVAALARPDGRMVGSAGHDRARDWLLGQLAQAALSPYAGDAFELPYTAAGVQFTNVLARLPGADSKLPPLLLAAHYDTAGPFPGADDNAAAIAILLSLARRWREGQLPRDVVFAFFDAEEPPYFLSPAMGSVHFYHHQRSGPVHCAVVLDLVGHAVPIPGLDDLLFITGIESDPALPAAVEAMAPVESLRLVPTLNRYIGDLSDHHVFRLDRKPYLFLSCGRWAHYHSPTDTPEKLDYPKMAAIGKFLDRLLEHVAAVPLEGPFEGGSSLQTELRFLRAGFGPVIEALGLPLATRQDVDRAAAVLMAQFGL